MISRAGRSNRSAASHARRHHNTRGCLATSGIGNNAQQTPTYNSV
jgi:hypothetical protein